MVVMMDGARAWRLLIQRLPGRSWRVWPCAGTIAAIASINPTCQGAGIAQGGIIDEKRSNGRAAKVISLEIFG